MASAKATTELQHAGGITTDMTLGQILALIGGAPQPEERTYSVDQLAMLLQVKPHVVLAFISAGELKAENIASPGSKRPRWRIWPDELKKFRARRTQLPVDEPTPRRRKKTGPQLIDPKTGKVKRTFKKAGSLKAAMET